MRYLHITATFLFLLRFAAIVGAQSDAVYVNHDKVSAALAKGGALVDRPQVRVAGGHRDKPGALDTQPNATTIIFVTDGGGLFTAGAQSHALSKGDLIVVPAGTTQSFKRVSLSISYYLVRSCHCERCESRNRLREPREGCANAEESCAACGWTKSPSIRRLSKWPVRARR